MNSIPVRRLQFFTIRSRNLAAARRFYVEMLGFEVISEKTDEYVQVAIAGVPVCVDATSEDSPRQNNQIGIEVGDLQQTLHYLQERGLSVESSSAGSEHWASVKDPDGHEILFIANS